MMLPLLNWLYNLGFQVSAVAYSKRASFSSGQLAGVLAGPDLVCGSGTLCSKCALDDLLLLSPAVFVWLGVGRAFTKSHLQADLRVICLGVLLPFILCLAFLA